MMNYFLFNNVSPGKNIVIIRYKRQTTPSQTPANFHCNKDKRTFLLRPFVTIMRCL